VSGVRIRPGGPRPIRRGHPSRTRWRPPRRRGHVLRRCWRLYLPELGSFPERLRSALASRSPARSERPEGRRAAVAILVTNEAKPAILFIRRRERAGDPWSGQMALPGGFVSPGDESLAAAARRETTEETGVVLQGEDELIGELDDVSPRTPYLPPLVVTPFVFLVGGRPAARPGPEVEATVWLAVDDLYDPHRRRPYRLRLAGAERTFESIVIGEYVIWGLTERILQQLAVLAGV
jgi:8-oxo-dGTP pyrophosphatase MutT (NUDIX family)